MNLKIKSLNKILPKVNKLFKEYSKHAMFAAVLLALMTYIFLVFKISSLSKAEPAPDQVGSNENLIPRVNQKAINQIQALENNNTQIHSLFEHARNNPFAE
jgi:hypothetical protein